MFEPTHRKISNGIGEYGFSIRVKMPSMGIMKLRLSGFREVTDRRNLEVIFNPSEI